MPGPTVNKSHPVHIIKEKTRCWPEVRKKKIRGKEDQNHCK